MDDYRDRLLAEGLAENSVRVYSSFALRFRDWCLDHGHDPTRPNRIAVRAFSLTLPSSASTRKQAVAALRHYCKLYSVEAAVAEAVDRPRRSPKPRWRSLSPDVVRDLLAYADRTGDVGTAIYIGLYAGLRRSEIAALRWDDIDLEQRTLVAFRDKDDGWHRLPIADQLLERLAPRHPGELGRSDLPWVFPGRHGGHIAPGVVNAWITRAARETGHADNDPNITPHTLRHTCATYLYRATGHDLLAVQRTLGHARPETTAGYIAADVETIRGALATLDYGAAS